MSEEKLVENTAPNALIIFKSMILLFVIFNHGGVYLNSYQSLLEAVGRLPSASTTLNQAV